MQCTVYYWPISSRLLNTALSEPFGIPRRRAACAPSIILSTMLILRPLQDGRTDNLRQHSMRYAWHRAVKTCYVIVEYRYAITKNKTRRYLYLFLE